ncbi:hypothetical protein BaRGS_00002094 [Batillaria attramentaria]|uniref:Methylated-DNA--protein-cysteine methyltransferase n=1 Tax=Batillaria attramentaria TaxID=370345 RepID=A0ABD0M5E7_9CAEN
MKKVCHHGPTNTFTVSTPIGEMLITSCPKGLHYVKQSPDTTDSVFKPDKSCKVELQSQLYEDNGYTYTPALQSIQWLKSYFDGEQIDKMPPLCPSILSEGTFTTNVWLKLPDAAPFGQTISYKELSQAAGSGGAARAVGQAMATNPIQLIIPCHRVICSNGTTGNYGRGNRNAVKEWLLQFENGEV